MEKLEPKCLPVWVKIINVPLEAWSVDGISVIASSLGKPIMMDNNTATMCHKAWSVDGISVIASSLGKPIMMDNNTATMCHKGIGSFEFARVLVEMVAEKELKKEIVIQYRDKNYVVKGNKAIKVGKEDQNSGKFKEKRKEMYQGSKSNNGINTTRNQSAKTSQSYQWQTNGNGRGRLNNNKKQEYRKRQMDDENLEKGGNNNKEKDKQNERNACLKGIEEEDVVNTPKGTRKFMELNEVNGMEGSVLNEDGYGFYAILETRLKCKKLQKTCDKVFQDWEWFSNMDVCNKWCRIVIGWDSETNIQILHKTSQVIFCIINAPKFKFKCYFSFVYAANKGVERRDLWKVLINDHRYVNGNPWCIAGDMNVILNPNEHSCGTSIMNSDMVEFQDCLNVIEMKDISNSGLQFTWTKNLHKAKVGIMTGVLKKLDRVMTNKDFIKSFPQAHAKFLPYIISDHSPAILCVPSNIRKKVKSFRFSNYITKKQKFIPIVKEKWDQNIQGVECLRKQLQEIQTSIDADLFDHNLMLMEAKLVEEFCEAESDEENFLHQQAKIKWLCDGDKNSKYFHRFLKGRSNKRKVFSLRDDSGNSYEQDQIHNLFLKHFEEFLGSTYPVKSIDSSGNLFKRKLSVGDADKMITNVYNAEIKRALFDIDDSKSPTKMLGELNATLVSLILKVQTPRKVTDFRPIACCNVLYKCISKVLTNRIKASLGNLERRDRIGYFKCGRGLRQGDPISPYLFTLIMEVFSLILQREIDREPLFQYHFGCKNLKVSHVCFADDLLVMCHGDATSVSVIKKALDEFSACSGLLPNNSKSTVFFGSMNEEECSTISNILPFVTRKLPVRYLGVPLIAKRLGVKECRCLLDKIKGRIKNWKNRYLFYEGRLQLIVAVLESIHNQNDSANGKGKVSWSSICKPKDQGGLGLRNLQEISADKEDSWGWKNLLEIRDQIKDYMVYKIGDGNSTSLCDMIREGEWKWPSEWHHKFPMITCLDVPAINTNIEDKIVKSKGFMEKGGVDRALLMADMRGDKNDWQSILHGMSDVGNGMFGLWCLSCFELSVCMNLLCMPFNGKFLVAWSSSGVTVPINAL
ncbi:RNA-directed DNA polymerase, eukaryota, reverse transcriptase zinc-binding domain protein [Tanacetum coccineum]